MFEAQNIFKSPMMTNFFDELQEHTKAQTVHTEMDSIIIMRTHWKVILCGESQNSLLIYFQM